MKYSFTYRALGPESAPAEGTDEEQNFDLKKLARG
jgi:hypothetical protein